MSFILWSGRYSSQISLGHCYKVCVTIILAYLSVSQSVILYQSVCSWLVFVFLLRSIEGILAPRTLDNKVIALGRYILDFPVFRSKMISPEITVQLQGILQNRRRKFGRA